MAEGRAFGTGRIHGPFAIDHSYKKVEKTCTSSFTTFFFPHWLSELGLEDSEMVKK